MKLHTLEIIDNCINCPVRSMDFFCDFATEAVGSALLVCCCQH
jgi:hypothetical protein